MRPLDIGGMVWEGKARYRTLYQALRALDAGIAAWLAENGCRIRLLGYKSLACPEGPHEEG